MKKFYAILLVLLTTCLCQLHATSKNGFIRVDNITYQVVDLDNAIVSVYKVDPSVTGTLTVPSTIKDASGKEFTVTGMEKDCILNTSITKIVLPSTLADNNGAKGFQYGSLACPTLTEIAIADGNSVFKIVDGGVLINANGRRLEAYPANKADKEYTLPSSVWAVMPFAFSEARNLETLTIDKACIWTHEYDTGGYGNLGAWANFYSLKNFKLEAGNTEYEVRDGVLYRATGWTEGGYFLCCYPAGRTDKSYSTPVDVYMLCEYSICGASNLEELKLNGVKYFSQPCILNCKNLKKITGVDKRWIKFKDNAMFDDKWTLSAAPAGNGTYTVPDYCTGLKAYSLSYTNYDKVVIPKSTTALGDHAFYRSNIKDIDMSQFSGKIWSKCFMGSKLEKVELPVNVSSIDDGAFQQCNNLKSVTFADGTTTVGIGEHAFADNPKLETVNFGSDSELFSISNGAFALCPQLRSLSVPGSVVTLGKGIAAGDTNLAYVDLSNLELNIKAVDRTSDIFDGMDAHTLVFLPQAEDDATAITGENIVNIDADGNRTAASIALYNKATSFETPYSFTASKVTYDRAFTNGTYATVAFPFALTSAQTDALGKMYAFQNVADNQAVFENSASSTTKAYQPYLLLSNGTAFSAENVKFEKASENSVSGDFAACFEATNESGKLGLNSDFSATKAPVFRTLADGETILPFHAYITSTASSLPVKGAEATNISNIRANGKVDNSVYTLNGSKFSTMPTQPGVYIIGNKKVLVK